MTWVFGALAVTVGAVLLWALIAPRSQWRTLVGWTVADAGRSEPGGAAYAWRRFIAAVGVVGILTVLGTAAVDAAAREPLPAPPLTAVEKMWGQPVPRLVDRVISPLDAAPEGLVAVPVLGYQDLDDDLPSYLRQLPRFTLLGDSDPLGFVGSQPGPDVTSTGLANLVVHVRGPLLCIPREVVVVESETEIRVGVFYGVTDPPDGSPADHLAACGTDTPAEGGAAWPGLATSVLIPIPLSDLVGDRAVLNLDGEPLTDVPIID